MTEQRRPSADPPPVAESAAAKELVPPSGGARIVPPDSFTGRVSTLHEIALQIDAARSRDEVMRVLRNEVRWIIAHRVCFVALLNNFHTEYTVVALAPQDGVAGLDGTLFPASRGVPGTVIMNQSPLCVDLDQPFPSSDAEEGATPADLPESVLKNSGMRTLLAVPLRTGDETTGVLGFASEVKDAFGEHDIVLAQLLATQVAIALQNNAMFGDAQRRISQIELVNELAEDLTSTLELEQLLAAAAETIRKTCNFFDVSIFLVDRPRQEAYLVAHSGTHVDFLPEGYRQKFSEGIVGWAITNDERVMSADVTQDPRYSANRYTETRSEMAIPIRVEHEIVGVLNVEDERPGAFDETDAIVLETLCDQMGSAIKNAQLYDRLKRTNAKLTEFDRMKSDFLGIVSHDFRSPLASIVLAASALLKRPDTVDTRRLREYLTVIVDQANRLIRLAEDTLSMTKMEAGQLSYFFNMVNLERLIKDTVSTVMISGRHTVSYEIDPRVAYVRGDQTKLRQVLQNLLSNAVKYSPSGGKVTIRAAHHNAEQLVVAVTDEGIGIPAEQQGKLFQKFSRVDSPQSKHIKGSGLGLWICREIVRAHGGQIWVESHEGRGSTFAFTLKKAHPDTTLE
ncbi:MAG TPA: GAF domain-containing protein [Bacteroidota bacterium]|nr:GAF domain-containing protein [Bacteroidota bacterium]